MEPTNPGPESVPPVPPSGNPPPGNPPPGTPPPITPDPGSSSTPPPMPGELGAIPSKDERMWAMLIHLSGLLGASLATFTFVPANLLIPLILWLIKREGNPFVNDQGKECINFQITITIVAAVLLIPPIVCIGIFLLPVLGVYALVVAIVAAVKSNEGVPYRYPLTIRLIT